MPCHINYFVEIKVIISDLNVSNSDELTSLNLDLLSMFIFTRGSSAADVCNYRYYGQNGVWFTCIKVGLNQVKCLTQCETCSSHSGFYERGRNHLEDRGVDGRIILSWFFRKWNVRAWTGSSCVCARYLYKKSMLLARHVFRNNSCVLGQ
jgi:hypothetical protein